MHEKDFIIEDGVLIGYIGNDEHVIIPEGVHTIGSDAFGRKEVTWRKSGYSSIDHVPPMFRDQYFSGTIKDEKRIFPEFIRRVSLNEGVRVIESRAFEKAKVEQVDLPESLREIKSYAFRDCQRLKEITLPSKLRSIGMAAFQGCFSLTNIVLPEDLEELKGGAFQYCRDMETVILPKNLRIIERDTFSSCRNLENVVLPDGIEHIMYNAFLGCRKLKPQFPKGCRVYQEDPRFGRYYYKEDDSLFDIQFTNGIEMFIEYDQ